MYFTKKYNRHLHVGCSPTVELYWPRSRSSARPRCLLVVHLQAGTELGPNLVERIHDAREPERARLGSFVYHYLCT
jgi:hypothetical protein